MTAKIPASLRRVGKRRNPKRALFIFLMLLFPIVQFLIFFVYVNIDSVVITFQHYNYDAGKIEWGLMNYQRFFEEFRMKDQIKNAIVNSLMVGANDLLLVLISVILSYFFYKKVPGYKVYRVIYFLPSIISIVIYTAVYKIMFTGNGIDSVVNSILKAFGVKEANIPLWLGDKRWAKFIILSYCLWVGTGYNILLFGGAMSNLPSSVMENSRLEGNGMFRELFTIVIPMIWPTLSVSILGSFMVVFTFFIQVQLLTGGGPNASTETIAFLINNNVSQGNQEWAATIGIIFTLVATPIILIVKKLLDLVYQKFNG